MFNYDGVRPGSEELSTRDTVALRPEEATQDKEYTSPQRPEHFGRRFKDVFNGSAANMERPSAPETDSQRPNHLLSAWKQAIGLKPVA